MKCLNHKYEVRMLGGGGGVEKGRGGVGGVGGGALAHMRKHGGGVRHVGTRRVMAHACITMLSCNTHTHMCRSHFTVTLHACVPTRTFMRAAVMYLPLGQLPAGCQSPQLPSSTSISSLLVHCGGVFGMGGGFGEGVCTLQR